MPARASRNTSHFARLYTVSLCVKAMGDQPSPKHPTATGRSNSLSGHHGPITASSDRWRWGVSRQRGAAVAPLAAQHDEEAAAGRAAAESEEVAAAAVTAALEPPSGALEASCAAVLAAAASR